MEGTTKTNPLNVYGKSKLELEKFATSFTRTNSDLTVIGLRYCNVYGPRESHKGKMASMIYQLAQQMLKGNPRLFKSGEQKRDYIYIDDVVRANLLASQTEKSCLVNCGSGKATTFNDLINILNRTLKLNRTQNYIDNPKPETYQSHTECDMNLARDKIGFVPEYNIESGIRAYHESGFLIK